MLAPHDADLIRREKELPGFGLLLDTERFVRTLQRLLPDVDLGAAETTYFKYRPGKYCRVGYAFAVDGIRVPISATAHARGYRHRVRRARRLDSIPGPLGGGQLILEKDLVVVSVFPNDRHLAALATLSNVESIWALLLRLRLVGTEARPVSIEILRYRPERRCVAEVSSECAFRGILKLYSEAEYALARENAAAFHSVESLRIPRRLGCLDRERIVAFEYLPGRVLARGPVVSSLDTEVLYRVAAALAELHAQKPLGLQRRPREPEVLPMADLVSFLCPQLAPRVHRLAQELRKRGVREPFDTAIHGDFSPRQILLDSDTVGLVDFDNAGLGDPTEDLGSFLARFERASISGLIDPHVVEPMGRMLLEGYASARGRSVGGSIAVATALALFRMVSHPFRRRETNWPDRIAAMLDRVEFLLQNAHAMR